MSTEQYVEPTASHNPGAHLLKIFGAAITTYGFEEFALKPNLVGAFVLASGLGSFAVDRYTKEQATPESNALANFCAYGIFSVAAIGVAEQIDANDMTVIRGTIDAGILAAFPYLMHRIGNWAAKSRKD